MLGGNVCAEVHSRSVHPDEEGFGSLDLTVHEVHRGSGSLVVDSFHALLGERPCVLNLLLADMAKARVLSRIIFVRCPGMQHASWPHHLCKPRVSRIIEPLRIFG